MLCHRKFAILGIAVLAPLSAAKDLEILAKEALTLEVPASQALIVFEGIVFDRDGAPVEGAVVVSSAGGQAVTGRNGSYRLEAEVPADARSIWISAVGAGAGESATTAVDLRTGQQLAPVPPLELAGASACRSSWLPTFGSGPGTNGDVEALAVFDDGDGPALYAGGAFSTAGGAHASSIAKWDGSRWSPVGSGTGGALALAVFDDGSGPALYAGGSLLPSSGMFSSFISKWDGSSWTGVGGGVSGQVRAMAVFDDGNGPALYVGGDFITAGSSGMVVNRIAKWNGSAWSELGGGMPELGIVSVRALTVFDDGSGPALYAGGNFSSAGGVAASGIARWEGSSWSALGSGVSGGSATVRALAVFDDGSGPALHAGGLFSLAGGIAANNIAKWDGSSWTALGTGVNSAPLMNPSAMALTVFDDGTGPALFVGGAFANAGGAPASCIAKWNGSRWSALGSGMGIPAVNVQSLAVFDDGSGPALFAGGRFATAGGTDTHNIAKWQGSSWTELGTGGITQPINDLAVFDDGRGPALYGGGNFLKAGGGVAASRIARWDGSRWEALGSGTSGIVHAVTVFDDGGGPALHVGGEFTMAGGVSAQGVAKWDGTSWSAQDSGLSGSPLRVHALVEFDDGNGPALYAGGSFQVSGGRNVARWDGSSWVAVGGQVFGEVRALQVFDDGNGPALYAGGGIQSAGGVQAIGIAKWNGSSWSALGSGARPVEAMAVFDDGNGPALYVGGRFVNVGVILHANGIARWNGSSWTGVGGGVLGGNTGVLALHVFDDGCEPALYVGGSFLSAGPVAGNHIARWDGSSWSPLGGGVGPASVGFPEVYALTTFNDRTGLALYAGGIFDTSAAGDSCLAKWGSPDTTAPVITCPAPIVIDDRPVTGPGEIVSYVVIAKDEQDPTPSVECHPPSGSHFPRGTTLVVCTATDFAGNQASCQFTVTVGAKVPEVLSSSTRTPR